MTGTTGGTHAPHPGHELARSAEFTPTADAAAGVRRAAEEAATAWGIPREAGRLATAAQVLVGWLADNDSPGTPITLHIEYQPEWRHVRVHANDGGTMLPALGPGDAFRRALAAAADVDNGAYEVFRGRKVYALLRITAPFLVRYTWRVAAGERHPSQTYEPCETREQAAVAAEAHAARRDAPNLATVQIDIGEATPGGGPVRWTRFHGTSEAAA